MPFHLDSPKNYSTPTSGVNTKNISYRISPNKYSKFLLLSLKSFVAEKRHGAMQKLFKKVKRKKESSKKIWISVRDI
jgi:hypothetical protein